MAGYTHFGMNHMRGFGGDVDRVLDYPGDFEPGWPVFFVGKLDRSLKIASSLKNLSGSAMTDGQVVSRLGDADGLTSAGTITAGTTTSATTSGLTAGDHDGAVFWVTDDAGAAGAAPEGEASIVKKNTATLITLDSKYPLSVAIANADTAQMWATQGVHLAADNDTSSTVMGAVLPTSDDIPDNQFGWVQSFGPCWKVAFGTGALAINKPLVAGAGIAEDAAAAEVGDHVIGKVMGAVSVDLVAQFIAAFLNCGHMPMTMGMETAFADG